MIESEEIEIQAKLFGIDTSDVQRDYLFGWFLFGLFSISNLKDIIFLKGGNALRKCYFENTRYSSDLDLGIQNDISPDILQTEINKICDFVNSETNIVFNKEQNRVREKFVIEDAASGKLKVYEARIYFRDFYGEAKHIVLKIKLDITRFDKVYLPLQNQALIHPYSDFEKVRGTVKCHKLEEIIGTKLKCILQREHPPDLFDYVYTLFFNNKFAINKGEIVSVFLKKTIFEPSPGVAKNILLNLPMDFFRSFWSRNIVCAKDVLFDVDLAITKFREGIGDIFSIYPDVSYADSYFFPAHYRNSIMQAGRNQTLLKMTYKNRERIVEPYALKYKEAQGKPPREYLFVYEISGGSKDEPGIRSYISENIQSIENTDIKFIVRDGYEIELCKAGEPIKDKYFTDNDRIKVPKWRKSRVSDSRKILSTYYGGPKYTYQCSSCLKKIVKKTMDSTIGSHKNKYGGECYGRYGYLVNTKY